MKTTSAIVLLLFLVGCASVPVNKHDQVRTQNRQNLIQLYVGMPKAEVLRVMGTETVDVEYGSKINNPYRTETLKGKDGQMYEVLFYYTDIKKADGAITDDELTPIVLKDGKTVGWGWSFLNDNVTQYQIDIRSR